MSSPVFPPKWSRLWLWSGTLLIAIWLTTAVSNRFSSSTTASALALCASPSSTIDLVPPPIDLVPTLNAEALIGSKFKFEVAFDNKLGTQTGYGPYIDIIFPRSGIDGPPSPDGIAFDPSSGSGAEHLGVPIPPANIIEQVFPNTGTLSHPFTLQSITGTPGDELVTIALPYASYTKFQQPARILINAKVSNLADLNAPLTIKTRAGFRYGCTGTSAPVPSSPNPNDSGTVTPVLFRVEKKYDGPEIDTKTGETATGPSFPRHYTIDVYVAQGQPPLTLTVKDLLPDNLAFVSVTSVSSGGTPGPLPPTGVAASGSVLPVTFSTITGAGLPTPDASVTFEFFIPAKDAFLVPILDPANGAAAISENNVTVESNWTPADPRDPSGPQIWDVAGPEYTLVCKSIALQKSAVNLSKNNANVAAIMPPTDNSPKDFILNTIDFQISDYFIFSQLTIDDIVSDGQNFLQSPSPSLTITDQQHTTSANVTPVLTTLPCGVFQSGRTQAVFTIPGSMTGAAALATPSSTPATGKLIFRTRILEDYACTPPSGDTSVDQNDKLFNRATIKGAILNNSTLQPTGTVTQDDGEIEFGLLIGVLTKSVYAHRNRQGLLNLSPSPTTLFAPGDQITFRLQYQLPHGDIENFSIEDLLPLPLLDVNQFTAASLSNCGGGVPPAGSACFGPLNMVNISGRPLVNVNVPGNSLKFDYLTFDDPSSIAKKVDILFTLTIQDAPYMDGQTVINQSSSSESNSGNDPVAQVAGASFLVAEPKLRIRKGVIATSNSTASFNPPLVPIGTSITSALLANANALQSNLNNVDAGDSVTFAVVVENLGSSPYGAFDVRISDTIPSGFALPTSLTVTNGNNQNIPFTGSVANFFGTAGIFLNNSFSFNLGSLKAFSPNSGTNIAVIKYTLQVPSLAPCSNHANTATIKNYSSAPGGPNYAFTGSVFGGPFSDAGTVTFAKPTITKKVIFTDNPQTTLPKVKVFENVTYQIDVQLPEGTTPSVIVTDLPTNLNVFFVGNISGNYPVTTSPTINPSTFPAGCGTPVTVNFGTISVPADNNIGNNGFKFELMARVCPPSGPSQASNIVNVMASTTCQSSGGPKPLTIVP